MRALFSRSRPAILPVTIGLLLASMILAPASITAQEDRPPKSPTGLMSLEELNRDIRPRIRKLAEPLLADENRWQESVKLRIGPRIKGGGKEAASLMAKLAREIAELVSKEYNEAAAPLERSKLEAEIRVAEAAIRSSEADLRGIEAIVPKAKEQEPASIFDVLNNYRIEKMQEAARLTLVRDMLGFEQAKGKLLIFDQFTKSSEEDPRGIEAIAPKAKEQEPASIFDVLNNYRVEKMQEAARLTLVKDMLGLEQAKGNLLIFDKFTKPKRTRELRSEIEKSRSDELMKQESLMQRNRDIASRKSAVEFFKNPQKSIWEPVLRALGEIVRLEAELHERIKGGPPADPKERASWDEKSSVLASRLRTALGEAEQLRDDIDFGALGRRIHKAVQTTRSSPFFEQQRKVSSDSHKAGIWTTPDGIGHLLATLMIAPPGDTRRSGPISIEELNREVRPRIRKLAKPALDARMPEEGVSDELINRRIEQQGAEAVYQQSKLVREVAEIMVKEYTEGIEPQDRATINGEIRLAENAIARSKERVSEIEAVLQKMKKFQATTIYDMLTVYDLEKNQRAAQVQILKDQIELEQAQGKLKRYNDFQKPRRIKELLSDVEKARGVESTAKENLDSVDEDVALLKQRVELARKRKKPDRAPVFSALDEAVGLEDALQTQLKESPPAEPKERATWDEKLNTQTAKLRAALDRAEQLSDDVEFEQLAERVRELVRDTEAAGTPKSEK